MFKVGDNIKCIRDTAHLKKGQIYKVLELDDDGDPIVNRNYDVGDYSRLFVLVYRPGICKCGSYKRIGEKHHSWCLCYNV